MKFFSSIFAISLNLILAGSIIESVRSQTPVTTIEQPQIKIREINLKGNTVFTSELKEITKYYEGKTLTPEQIFDLKNKLTKFYHLRGYINSGAFIPPQKFQNGQIKINIIEGTLAKIRIKGLNNLSENYLKVRLPPINSPLNVNQLNESLILLKKNLLIANLSAEIVPQGIGKNVLLLEIEEKNPLDGSLRITNAYSPSIGSFGGNASITHHNLLGFGDRLKIDRSQTEGLRRTGGSYSFPINSLDGRIGFEYNAAHSEVITEEIESLAIEADYDSFVLSLNQPVIFQSDEQFILGLKIEHIDSESFVLEDFSFSFTEGLPDGKSKITALRLSQEYVKNWSNALLIVKSQFNVGLDIFDATRTERGIDGIFSSWQGDLQYLLALNRSNKAILATRMAGQLSTDTLLPTEQFTIGGQGSVLGYHRNIGNADNGVLAIMELQLPFAEEKWGTFSLLPFINAGTIWNNERDTTGADFLASVGLGLSYRLASAFEARFNYAIPLVDPDGFENSETTDNFTFSLVFYPLSF